MALIRPALNKGPWPWTALERMGVDTLDYHCRSTAIIDPPLIQEENILRSNLVRRSLVDDGNLLGEYCMPV